MASYNANHTPREVSLTLQVQYLEQQVRDLEAQLQLHGLKADKGAGSDTKISDQLDDYDSDETQPFSPYDPETETDDPETESDAETESDDEFDI
jgi:hypothetical protein